MKHVCASVGKTNRSPAVRIGPIVMNIHHDHTQDVGFRYPAPSRATRNWGNRCPFAMRGTMIFNDRVVQCESGLESKTLDALAGRHDVVDIWEQPEELLYIDDEGKPRRHTVDFRVTMRDGTRYAVLVKPKRKAEACGLDRVRDLLAAQAPRAFADRYVIITEDKLPRHVVSNGALFSEVRAYGPFADDPDVEAVLAVVTEPMTVSRAVELTGLAGQAFRALVRCALERRIRLVDDVRFDYAAVIAPTAKLEEVSA